jgi:phosphopantothenoylcysteine decarboxylase / phosphopantothenate---cysteine ligase
VIHVISAVEMLQAVESSLPADIAIFTAAVADWKVATVAGEKIKKQNNSTLPSLSFTENPDILKSIATLKSGRPKLVVGFAAETENVLNHAKAKLTKKGCDLIIANDVSPEGGVFGGDKNTVHIVSTNGVESWPAMSKQDVAAKLMDKLVSLL